MTNNQVKFFNIAQGLNFRQTCPFCHSKLILDSYITNICQEIVNNINQDVLWIWAQEREPIKVNILTNEITGTVR